MDDYIFGANILENLTTGMYKDSKVSYREYIQNELEESIPKTSSFKKIYSYIDGVLKHTNILNEEYKLRLK